MFTRTVTATLPYPGAHSMALTTPRQLEKSRKITNSLSPFACFKSRPSYSISVDIIIGRRGQVVAYFVEALSQKPERRGCDSR
jgi:hypothetical protein